MKIDLEKVALIQELSYTLLNFRTSFKKLIEFQEIMWKEGKTAFSKNFCVWELIEELRSRYVPHTSDSLNKFLIKLILIWHACWGNVHVIKLQKTQWKKCRWRNCFAFREMTECCGCGCWVVLHSQGTWPRTGGFWDEYLKQFVK